MRTTAKLVCDGHSKDEVVDNIVKNNLFQYHGKICEKSCTCLFYAGLMHLLMMALLRLLSIPSDITKQDMLICHDETISVGLGFHDYGNGSHYQLMDTIFW